MFHIFSRSPKAIFKGYLPELDGHKIYFQVFGNPNGKTIINFHGGPGSKSKFKHVKHFNLKKCIKPSFLINEDVEILNLRTYFIRIQLKIQLRMQKEFWISLI